MILTLPLDLAIIFAFALGCAGLGRRLQARFGLSGEGDPPGHFLVSAGLGLLAVSYLTFALGYSGLLYRAVFIPLLLLLLWLGRGELSGFRSWARGLSFAGLSRAEKALLAVLLLAVLFNLFFNYCPPTAEDETSTHLGIPAKWLAARAIYSLPGAPAQYFPSGILTQYTFLAAAGSVQTARLFHYVSGIFCLFAVYLLARRFLERPAALLAASIFYTLPVVTSLSGIGNTDFGTLFFALLSVYAFFDWLAEKTLNRLLLAAVLTGAHAACKYSAFPLLIILPLFVLYEERSRLRRAAGHAAVFAAVSFSALLPYLLRNALVMGNPLYPKRLFGLPYEETLYYSVIKTGSLRDLLGKIGALIPGGVIWGIGPLFAAFLPLVFVYGIRDEEGRNISHRLLLIAALYFLLLFAAGIGFQLGRHSLLSYTLLAVPIAGALAQFCRASRLRGYVASLLALSLLTNLSLSLYFGGKRLPVFLGLESARSYFDSGYVIWEKAFFVKYINDTIPAGTGILFMNNPAPELNYPRHRVFSLEAFDKDFYRFTPEAAAGVLDRNGIVYIVVTGTGENRSDSGLVHYAGPDGETPVKWFSAGFGELLVSRDNVSLYKLVKPAKAAAAAGGSRAERGYYETN